MSINTSIAQLCPVAAVRTAPTAAFRVGSSAPRSAPQQNRSMACEVIPEAPRLVGLDA